MSDRQEQVGLAMLVPLPFLGEGDATPYWDWAVYFSATTSENRSQASTVSSRSTETGATITDHVFPQPQQLQISGQITGPDAADKLELLRHFWKSGGACLFVGRVFLKPVVVERFNDSYDNSISNGFRFSMTLKQVIVVDAPEFENAEYEDWIPPVADPPEPVPKIPDADFVADVTTGDAPLTVKFTDTSDWKDAYNNPKWWWNVGDIHWLDGEEGLQFWGGHKTKTHTYQYPGEYTVGLRVQNSFGVDTEIKEQYITVTGNPPDVRRRLGIIDAIVETLTFTRVYDPSIGRYVFAPIQFHIGKYWGQVAPGMINAQMVIRPDIHSIPGKLALTFYFSGLPQNTIWVVYGTPFLDPFQAVQFQHAFGRFRWIVLDITDTETDITPENFNKSVKLHLYDTEMVET